MSCLVITSGRNKGGVYKLAPGAETVLGRVSECSIHILDARVSRRHCVIAVGPAGAVLRDLQSVNGTFVNGARVTETALKDGDKVVVGTTELQFRQAAPANGRKTEALVSADRPPEPGKTPVPAPVETVTPVPVAAAKPAPVETVTPVPAPAAKPAPEEVIEPVPVEAVEPVPVEAAKPMPVETATPVPAQAPKPPPVETATPVPTEAVKPVPEEVIEPVPVEAIEPVPADAIAPVPVEAEAVKAGPAPVPAGEAPAGGSERPGWFRRILGVFSKGKKPEAPEAK